jgi:patatin-like phospholipase/acyl hydrolase
MKRVLAIDGGGIRGIIPAILCRAFEKWSGKRICELFDLVAGTSTGGILALGFTVPPDGLDADKLVSLYESHGHTIFGTPRHWLGRLKSPKYAPTGLERVLKEYFGDSLLSQAIGEVLVTSYDIERRRPRVLKRWRAMADHTQDCLIREACRATSAAPTYFPPARVGGRALIDGGIYSNNPAALAFAEAKRCWPEEYILVVSLGTGSLQKPILFDDANGWGLAGWAVPLLDCVFDGTSDLTHYIMQYTLANQSYWRFQCMLGDGASERLDDVSKRNIVSLKKLGEDLVNVNRDNISRLVTMLVDREATHL